MAYEPASWFTLDKGGGGCQSKVCDNHLKLLLQGGRKVCCHEVVGLEEGHSIEFPASLLAPMFFRQGTLEALNPEQPTEEKKL